uniref:Ig-like domain-containing protein n=1 Tax=Xiphophorus couchianus TaxID=32473 RepID=A0A3B5MU87_9TELE
TFSSCGNSGNKGTTGSGIEGFIHFLFSLELTSNANLRVAPSREPLFTRKLDILEVIEGRTARFDCKVSGSPAPRVTWRHFGKELQIEGGRHSLVISHVSSDTEGFYTAVAQNVYGKSECTAELYVQESGGRGDHSEEDEAFDGLL